MPRLSNSIFKWSDFGDTTQGKTVYVFDPGNCGADMTSEVIDSDCNSLGFLGGISGNFEINGGDFSDAIFQITTWEK